MKKTIGILISVLLIVSLFVPLGESKKYAADSSLNGYIVSEQNGKLTKREVIKVTSANSSLSTNALLKKVRKDFKEEKSKGTFNYSNISSEETPKYISTTTPKATASAASAGTATIEQKTIFDKKNKRIIISSTITKLAGKKPIIVITGNDLFASNHFRKNFKKVIGYDVEWTGADIRVGKTKKKTYKVTSTKFWTSKGSTTVGVRGSLPISTSSQLSGPVLTNKKGVIYPKIYDTHSKKEMSKPTEANMKKVAKKNKVKWNTSRRNTFRKAYIKKYGDPNFSWKGEYTEVHHIIPREYGGTNAFNNLIPLPKEMHRSVVSPWWTAY